MSFRWLAHTSLQKATILGEDFFIKILSLLQHKLGITEDISPSVDRLEAENFIQQYIKN